MRTLLRIAAVIGVLLLAAPASAGTIFIGSFSADDPFGFGEIVVTLTNDSGSSAFEGTFDAEMETDLEPTLATVVGLGATLPANFYQILAYSISVAALTSFQFSHAGAITYKIDDVAVALPQISVGQTLSIFYEPVAAVPESSTRGVLLTGLGAVAAFCFRRRLST